MSRCSLCPDFTLYCCCSTRAKGQEDDEDKHMNDTHLQFDFYYLYLLYEYNICQCIAVQCSRLLQLCYNILKCNISTSWSTPWVKGWIFLCVWWYHRPTLCRVPFKCVFVSLRHYLVQITPVLLCWAKSTSSSSVAVLGCSKVTERENTCTDVTVDAVHSTRR